MNTVVVRVLSGEYVVQGGTSETRWWLHRDRRWQRVERVEGVASEPVSAGPGTVWQRLHEVRVAPGEWLLREDRAPAPERLRDPLEYLERERRGQRRHVKRRYYRASRTGRLESAPKELAPR